MIFALSKNAFSVFYRRVSNSLSQSFALFLLITSVANGQVVRFESNGGNFDLMLNPTGNALLQGHVDNFLQYITTGRYDGTVINRADEGFVL